MKKLRIAESNIPIIEYDNIWDCVLDNSLETKKYLQNFDLPKNKYDGEFAFILKVKGMKDIFLVVNCFSSSILIESIGIFNDFEDENASLNEVICRSSYNLRKAVLFIKKYENRELLSMRDFKFLYRSLNKSYKKLKEIKCYDYAHIKSHLIELQKDKDVQGYYYLKGGENNDI